MPHFLLAYDLKKTKNYPRLWGLMRQWNAVRVLDSNWLADLVGPAETIRKFILQYVDHDDEVVVIELVPGMDWASRVPHTSPHYVGVRWLLARFPFRATKSSPVP